MSGYSQVFIRQLKLKSGETKFHYQWVGPIDGEIRVDFTSLGKDFFSQIPFKLMRMRNLPDGRTAVFIRVDWRAKVVRFLKSFWRLIHE